MIASTVATGAQPVVVARCVSADGRPAAQIAWVTAVNGNATSASTAGADNTVTITSQYMLVPTAADNGKDISCLVSHRTQAKPESFLMKLAIECKATAHTGAHMHNTHALTHAERILRPF